MPIITPRADAAPDFLATCDYGAIGGAAAVVGGLAYLVRLPRVIAPKLLTNTGIFVGTAVGNYMVGLYTTTDAVGTATEAFAASFTALSRTAETAMAGTNVWQEVALVTPYWYLPGTNVWAVYGGDGAATIGRAACSSTIAPANAVVLSKTAGYASNTIISPIASTAGSALAPILRFW